MRNGKQEAGLPVAVLHGARNNQLREAVAAVVAAFVQLQVGKPDFNNVIDTAHEAMRKGDGKVGQEAQVGLFCARLGGTIEKGVPLHLVALMF